MEVKEQDGSEGRMIEGVDGGRQTDGGVDLGKCRELEVCIGTTWR